MLNPPGWFVGFANFIRQIFGIVTGIQQAQMQQATQAETDLILSDINAVSNLLTSGTDGLTAIKNAVDDLATLVGTNDTAILAAIGLTQQAANPVILPTTPPTGYGNVAPSAIATAVWTYIDPIFSTTTIALLDDASANQLQNEDFNAGALLHGYAGWSIQTVSNTGANANPGPDLVPLDFTTTIATDATAVDWMNRLFGPATFFDAGGGAPAINDTNGFTYWVPWLNQPTFEILRDRALGLGKTIVPPVWPGLAGVTLLTPVAIDTGVTITETMDGVLIDITAAPVKQGYFTFDTVLSYRNIGALAFFTDDNAEEFPQTLGFDSAVYCPKTMQHAAGVVFRSSVGLTGTITPFIVN